MSLRTASGRGRQFSAAALLASLTACSMNRPAAPASCPLAAQKPMLQIELYFGRSIPGRSPVTDAEWEAFSTAVLSKEFPEGSTTLAGQGQWRDPQANETIHEPSILVLITVDPSSPYERKIAQVVDAYKQQFDQQAVGVVTEDVCARF